MSVPSSHFSVRRFRFGLEAYVLFRMRDSDWSMFHARGGLSDYMRCFCEFVLCECEFESLVAPMMWSLNTFLGGVSVTKAK